MGCLIHQRTQINHKIRLNSVRMTGGIVEECHITDVVPGLVKGTPQKLIDGTNTAQNAITILRNNNVFNFPPYSPFL